MDNSVWEHATDKTLESYLSLEPLILVALHREPELTILAFSVNDPLPDLPNYTRNE